MKVSKTTVYTSEIIEKMDVVVNSSTRESREDSKKMIQKIFNTLPIHFDDQQYKIINDYRVKSVKIINKL